MCESKNPWILLIETYQKNLWTLFVGVASGRSERRSCEGAVFWEKKYFVRQSGSGSASTPGTGFMNGRI